MSEWPKHDPITNRKICLPCWNGAHTKTNIHGEKVDACVGECDCVHLSEKSFAVEEKKAVRSNRRAKKSLMAQLLEESPLKAENPKFGAYRDAG